MHYDGEEVVSPLSDEVSGAPAVTSGAGHLYQQDGSPGFGKSVALNGQGAWEVDATKSEAINAVRNNFSVAAWIYLDSATVASKGNDNYRIVGNVSNGWGFGVKGTKLRLTKRGIADIDDPSGTEIPQDQWVHVAVTVSSTDGVNFFINGVDLDRSSPSIGDVNASTSLVTIASAVSGGEWFAGRVDEVRFYDSILTDFELDNLLAQPSEPDIYIQRSVNFLGGAVPQTHQIQIQNLGSSSALVIAESPTLSGPDAELFSVVSYPSILIPGSTGEITLSFVPDRGYGSYSADLDVTSNDPGSSVRSVKIAALTRDPLQTVLVDGYTDYVAYNPGDISKVYLNSSISITNAKINLYDIAGNLVLTHRADVGPQSVTTSEPWKQGYQYANHFTFTIPHLRSGVYRWEDNVYFMIRDPEKDSRISVVYETNTKNAYTTAGGKSSYESIIGGGIANYCSFRRPQYNMLTFNLISEYYWHGRGFFSWLLGEKDLDIGFICDADLSNYDNFKDSELLIIAGHSEYWDRQARINFDRFLADGKNVLFMSGNSMWWQIRYTGEDNSQMVAKLATESPDTAKTTTYNNAGLDYPITDSIGVAWHTGGWISNKSDYWKSHYPDLPPEPTLASWPKTGTGFGGYQVLDDSRPYFKDTGLSNGDVIHMLTHEHDGIPANLNGEGKPEFPADYPSFYYKNIVAWERNGTNWVGPIVELQKTRGAGLLINTNSTDWCSENSFVHSPNAPAIRQMTRNMIDYLCPPEPTLEPMTQGRVKISWRFGVLQSSLNGTTWSDHVGASSSPYTYTPDVASRQFRIRFDVGSN